MKTIYKGFGVLSFLGGYIRKIYKFFFGIFLMGFFEGLLLFLIGFFSCAFIISGVVLLDVETPLSSGEIVRRIGAPGDWVSYEDIHISGDKVVIDLKGASLSGYADTGSMKPVLDEFSNGIRVVPFSEEKIVVGDIVSFRRGNDLVVHRIVEKGNDSEGVYFITKGDNNDFGDGVIRFEDIEYVTVGVIW